MSHNVIYFWVGGGGGERWEDSQNFSGKILIVNVLQGKTAQRTTQGKDIFLAWASDGTN